MTGGPSRLPGDLLLARLGCNHQLRMLSTVSQLFDGDLMLGVVFIAINQAATDHLNLTRDARGTDEEAIVPNQLRRPVTVLSIAELPRTQRVEVVVVIGALPPEPTPVLPPDHLEPIAA